MIKPPLPNACREGFSFVCNESHWKKLPMSDKIEESGKQQEGRCGMIEQKPFLRNLDERAFNPMNDVAFKFIFGKEEFKNEEGWKGFHRIEKILWEQNTTKGTEKYADDLVNDIKELKAKIATIEVTPDLMVTGAIDLLNEVSTQKITGEEEVFSHTDLYDFRANIEGAQKIFELFRPKLEQKDAKLVTTLDTEFKAVNALLDKYMTDDKHYKLYTELTKEDTKALAEAVTKLGEPLSQMGIVIDATPKK